VDSTGALLHVATHERLARPEGRVNPNAYPPA
jgi:hypothetical protein